jgi:predicted dehydrogenase
MNTIGVIGSQIIESNAFAAELNENRKDLIKIYSERKTVYIDKAQFPFTELVEHADDIIHDQSIDTVFVSKQKLSLISSALKAGKSVRVI